LLRPFLGLARREIDAYVAARALGWVTDESNADTARKRNLLRHEIAPRLAAAFPGYPSTLARAAMLQAEAAELADALATLDAKSMVTRDAAHGLSLDRALLAELAAAQPARARNLLRWFLRERGLAAPSSARLSAMLEQLVHAAPDARVRLAHAGVELGMYRGRVVMHAPPVAPYAIAWRGETSVALPHGTLAFSERIGSGIAAAAIAGAGFTIRPRAGGERIRLAAGGPSRSLKHLLHDAEVAPWHRDAYPLVFCDAVLVAIPAIGVDVAFQPAPGAAGYDVRWQPTSAGR
jgi:tRNA(Ile)-lysidine synthase